MTLASAVNAVLQNAEGIRNLVLSLAALAGVWLAWRRVVAANRQSEAAIRQAEVSLEQQKLARRDHVAELFNKAVEQLVSEKIEVRLGAIFTLRQISRDFPDLADPTFQLLTAYLRHHARDYGDELPPSDIYEITETLKDRISQS